MYASALSAAIIGMEVCPIQVEADLSEGLPVFVMVGFPSAQVKESQDRVQTAFRNNGIRIPIARITVNFAPADIRKEGARYDLPLAASILGAAGLIPCHDLKDVMILGEMGLSGEVFATAGILPGVMKAREIGCRYCVIPAQNVEEASLVPGITCYGIRTLSEMIECLRHPLEFGRKTAGRDEKPLSVSGAVPLAKDRDFLDIHGQKTARRAAEIAASGFHNFLMIGPPGSGKTMIAHRMPTILPSPTYEEQLEITRIYSIAGLLSPENPLMSERPFRNPHHTCSPQALAGGGKIPVPGEITLAHMGVLFLDEMPEFGRRTLEILRQPLEERRIVISRISGSYAFPADFMLVAAMNPCPCGYYPDMRRCTCEARDVSSYMSRISQPLLDRIDLTTRMEAVKLSEIKGRRDSGESSAAIRSRVEKTIRVQRERLKKAGIRCNAMLSAQQIEKYCALTPEARRILQAAYEIYSLNARSYHRILKVARTLADMEGCETIREAHVSEAISFRTFDRRHWE